MQVKDKFLDYEPLARPDRQRPRPDRPPSNSPWREDRLRKVAATAFRGRGASGEVDELTKPDSSFNRAARPSAKVMTTLKKGHSLTFVGLLLFTFILYFRPYEMFSALSAFTSMAFFTALFTLALYVPTQLALEGTLTARPREVNLVFLLVLFALLSMPFAVDRGEAWNMFNKEFSKAVLVFIVMINVVRTKNRLLRLLWLMLAIGVVLSINAVGDYRSGNLTVEGYRVAGSIGGMFGNPNELAINLLISVPIAAALFLAARSIFGKLIYGACTVLISVAVVLTYSRGAFLALGAALATLIWKLRRQNRFFVFAAVVIGAAMLLALAPGGYLPRMLSIFNHSLDPVGSASQRQNILNRSITVALRNPLFGIGMGNFPIYSIRGLSTHNAYTQVASELGIFALAVYVLFLVSPFKKLRKIERNGPDGSAEDRWFYYLSVGIQASLIGYMVGVFFCSSAYQWYTYYLVGYAVCLWRTYEAGPDGRDDAADGTQQVLASQGPGKIVLG